MRKYKLISALAEETAKEVVRNEENWRRSDKWFQGFHVLWHNPDSDRNGIP